MTLQKKYNPALSSKFQIVDYFLQACYDATYTIKGLDIKMLLKYRLEKF